MYHSTWDVYHKIIRAGGSKVTVHKEYPILTDHKSLITLYINKSVKGVTNNLSSVIIGYSSCPLTCGLTHIEINLYPKD